MLCISEGPFHFSSTCKTLLVCPSMSVWSFQVNGKWPWHGLVSKKGNIQNQAFITWMSHFSGFLFFYHVVDVHNKWCFNNFTVYQVHSLMITFLISTKLFLIVLSYCLHLINFIFFILNIFFSVAALNYTAMILILILFSEYSWGVRTGTIELFLRFYIRRHTLYNFFLLCLRY